MMEALGVKSLKDLGAEIRPGSPNIKQPRQDVSKN